MGSDPRLRLRILLLLLAGAPERNERSTTSLRITTRLAHAKESG